MTRADRIAELTTQLYRTPAAALEALEIQRRTDAELTRIMSADLPPTARQRRLRMAGSLLRARLSELARRETRVLQ